MPTPSPLPMDSISGFMTNASTAVEGVFSWCADAVDFIISEPFIWVPMLIGIASAVTIGIVKAFVRG